MLSSSRGLPCQLFDLMPQYFVNASSRPLWYTLDQSPVLILGGIPNEKAILLSDTNFETFSLVEVSDTRLGGAWGLPWDLGPESGATEWDPKTHQPQEQAGSSTCHFLTAGPGASPFTLLGLILCCKMGRVLTFAC